MTRRTLTLTLLLAALCILTGASAARAQDGDHRAALVIRFGDGSVQTKCVSFSESSITGEELLQRSGLPIIVNHNLGSGAAVCSIAGAGCAFPKQDCFCHCQGLTCEYWAYYHRTDSGWQYASTGASSFLVNDGALEGWSWGPGNWASGTEPPARTFAEVCSAPATATPTVTATATATATATPSAAVPPQDDTAPPQVVFEANAAELVPGTCTVLSWIVSDANQVTLDGALVSAQGQRQICPPATQHFILVAANSAGQTVRELTVTLPEDSQVLAPIQPGSTPTRTPTRGAEVTPSVTPSRVATQASTVAPGLPTATIALAPVSGAQQPSSTPKPPRQELAGIAVAHAQEITPVATPIVPASHRLSSESVAQLVALPTSTPRPRRQLGADGRSTPTPILLAYAQPADSSGSRPNTRTQGLGGDFAANNSEAPNRSFSLTLLPGYAAYLLTLAGLVGAGVWVMRRKSDALRNS
jgi:hypothetical protein